MSKLELAPEVIRARKEAQKARDDKPLNEVIRQIKKERRSRELLVLKRMIAAK